MKVFISSVITGFEAYREAAVAAVRSLGYEIVRAEDFPASTRSPQVACLSGVRESDLVVLVLGERYGLLQPSGQSATKEEYEEAKGRKPLLVFVQEKVTMEPAQLAFRREVEAWQGGRFRKGFVSPSDLQTHVTEAVHRHTLELARGHVDEEEMTLRAGKLLPPAERGHSAQLALVVAWGPRQQILRPKELDDGALSRELHQAARFGENAIFDEHAATKTSIRGDSLVIEQPGSGFSLDELGSLVVEQPAVSSGGFTGWLVEEDLVDRLERALRFVNEVVGKIDGTERLTHGAITCALLDAAHVGWKTREELRRQPNSGTLSMGADQRIVASLRPPVRSREQLRHDTRLIAEDLAHLLRRAHSPRSGI